ncbi:hypothetical protein [Flavihumibacter sp. UBA7668]|uniref:hypothetical protein n=1 Tax=Flavihumibacter sp. UBA7668 TaxID=1946542 RepID=UPI0025C1E3BF|nr:hypothetical protein [Flavihumibacter sp. UBA7668]
MKKYKLLLSCLIAVFFTACIQIEEEVEIKEDGSGKMAVRTDMGQLFEMLKGFASPEDLQKDGLEKAMDTTILMKDIVDTVQELSAENKALLRNGKMQIQMNMKENLFKMKMDYPFNSLADANKLYKAMNEMGMMGNSLKNLGGAQQPGPDQPGIIPGGGSGTGIEKISSMYDIKFSNGEYSRILNQARFDSLSNDPKLQESKGMLGMMGDMNMNLTVKLPRKVKSVSNSNAVISADKKTVTLKGDMIAALDSPKSMEIIIRY